MSDDFYQTLPSFSVFSDYARPEHYTPLPEDWILVITDVKGSTQAIEQGRYKDVNALGVASIMALLNAVKPLEIPYVFGGDGANLSVPPSRLDAVKSALIATRHMARDSFGMELRIGIVAARTVLDAGHQVKVGKYKASPYYQQAMFWGGGLSYADALVKSDAPDNPYVVPEDEVEADANFHGFECRWNEIPSPNGETAAILVHALQNTDMSRKETFDRVNERITRIYGGEDYYRPVCPENLSLTFSTKKLSTEVNIHTAFQPEWRKRLYKTKLFALNALGKYLMARGVKTESTDWGAYKQTFVTNSDFQKFDELLRMIISGTEAQNRQLREFLEGERLSGKLAYGFHTSSHAMTTCIIFNYSTHHFHFLDGSNGGYAMAARELKRQLNKINFAD